MFMLQEKRDGSWFDLAVHCGSILTVVGILEGLRTFSDKEYRIIDSDTRGVWDEQLKPSSFLSLFDVRKAKDGMPWVTCFKGSLASCRGYVRGVRSNYNDGNYYIIADPITNTLMEV